ncbi:SAM-dependent methyltransferase [Reticulibacter mediterranei]|uniref:SAM-dependent methyltransferase n=1 Tax=Reticulibacter mediterranei TaxID=2778369 RepID=A0A8J3IMT1_9CHLR|nr:class I SAM-dependent methyltransferase [Reticulibacter mediterranei]GHO95263.1 SAM-dependent methyltransferase [Reticulibacter mediterranei]
MQNAIERWKSLIDARAQQMDAAYAEIGSSSADYWNRRAQGYHRATRARTASDPFFQKLSQIVIPDTTVLDVGAGTGRFTLALAPLVRQVIAVEPNAAMLSYLEQEASAQGLANISTVPTTWQDAPSDIQADIVICSHVLYPIREVDTFLAKLSAAARQSCYLYMRALHFDAFTAPLWQHFHGDARQQQPGYIDALAVLYEMGIYANVDIVKTPGSMRFPSLDIAVEELAEHLILLQDEATRTELHELLASWLVKRDGMLAIPADEMVSAIIWWTPQHT